VSIREGIVLGAGLGGAELGSRVRVGAGPVRRVGLSRDSDYEPQGWDQGLE
jgi:hypothetical protein